MIWWDYRNGIWRLIGSLCFSGRWDLPWRISGHQHQHCDRPDDHGGIPAGEVHQTRSSRTEIRPGERLDILWCVCLCVYRGSRWVWSRRGTRPGVWSRCVAGPTPSRSWTPVTPSTTTTPSSSPGKTLVPQVCKVVYSLGRGLCRVTDLSPSSSSLGWLQHSHAAR